MGCLLSSFHISTTLAICSKTFPEIYLLILHSYSFGLEMELVEEEGVWFTFNRNLEACFETHEIPAGWSIVFREWGGRCVALIKMFNEAVKALTKDADREFLRQVWLEWIRIFSRF